MHHSNLWTQLQKDGYDLVCECMDRSVRGFKAIKDRIESPKLLFRTFITIATSIFAIALICTYIVMMTIKPWLDGGGNWSYVQGVWSHWQTLNAAMIAFAASLVAVYAAKYQDKQKRESQLLAARAMLPQALSDLTQNAKELAQFYKGTYEFWQADPPRQSKKPAPPKLNIDSATVIFSNCMQHANIEVVEAMADVLSMNQYISARAQSEYSDISLIRKSVWRMNMESQLCELGEMQAKINRMFDYGRKLQSELKITELAEKEIIQGMLNIDIPDYRYPNAYKHLARTFGRSLE
ncbi:hypothetical protein L4D06_16600 [Enterovibrio makurazakiensis]|uniref:hypothetical protein n=1 Tax=Enterovibrio makurazakiensis TaxID=2910232 RepID=UPI003D1BF8F8